MTTWEHQADLRRQAFASGHAAELDVMLAAARTEIDEAAWARLQERLRGGLDWDFFVTSALDHGVGPLVYRSLRNDPSVPAEALEALRTHAHSLAVLMSMRRRELTEVVGDIEREGCSVLAFKGIALGTSAYGDPTLRKPGDIDLLIEPHNYVCVRALLEARGYQSRTPRRDEAQVLRTRSSMTFERNDVDVDLHWTLDQQPFDSFPFALRFDADALWREATPVSLNGASVRTLAPEHALLYACGHGVKHSWALFYSVCDVAETIRAFPDLDWNGVAAEAARHRVTRIYHLGLLLAHGLLNAPVPPTVLARAIADRRARAAARAVCGWVFDPDSTVGDVQHTLIDAARYYRYRVDLLERPKAKLLYLFYRGLRRFSRTAPSRDADTLAPDACHELPASGVAQV